MFMQRHAGTCASRFGPSAIQDEILVLATGAASKLQYYLNVFKSEFIYLDYL
jgi:hypothetical protein